MSNGIAINNLHIRRGKRPVLQGLTATIEPGIITGLLGPSGAGKTTLMRAIVGTQKIQSGTVTIAGHRAGTKALRSKLAYVTQNNSIYHDLSVAANVKYFAALYGRTKTDAKAAIETVGLSDHATQMAGKLSGGQQTRTSLACALVARPSILVLDEPTVGLDPLLREELWDEFAALATQGITIVVSSHVMDEAERCDRIILLREGDIVADDTPDALKTRTNTTTMDAAFLSLVHAQTEGA